MQKSESLLNGIPISKTIEEAGWVLPWEVQSFAKDYETAGSQGGIFDLSAYPIYQFQGPDALDYLHRVSTANFKTWNVSQVLLASFLDSKAHAISVIYLWKDQEKINYLVDPLLADATYTHLEKFHFQENFVLAREESHFAVGLYRPKEPELQKLVPLQKTEWQGGVVWRDLYVKDLFYGVFPKANSTLLQTRPLLGMRLFHYFRIEAGLIRLGKEADDKTLVLETGLEKAIAEAKGCYPGQEVVERVRSYGRVNRHLQKIEIESPQALPEAGFEVQVEGKPLIKVVTYEQNPLSSSKYLGLAYVHRSVEGPTQSFLTDFGATIKLLK